MGMADKQGSVSIHVDKNISYYKWQISVLQEYYDGYKYSFGLLW